MRESEKRGGEWERRGVGRKDGKMDAEKRTGQPTESGLWRTHDS
jgi:hypothetical protein